MERNQAGGGDPSVEATLPRELHDRVERLFREYRGYEPTSVQESLSVICDLAEAQLDADASDATSERASSGTAPSPVADDPVDDPAPSTQEVPTEQTDTRESTSSSEQKSPKPDSSGTIRAAIDEVFPTDWAAEADTAERLPLIVGHYLTAEGSTRIEPENTALAAVATRYGTTPERLRTEVVEDIYGADTLPGELASEFFSEALGKVEQRLERAETDVLSAVELVGGDSEQSSEERTDETGRTTTESTGSTDSPLDLGSGSTDLPAGLADDIASDGGAVQSVDERIDNLFAEPNGLTEIGIESLVDGAATDCEICGERYSVVDLRTTTEASDDRRVNLVCDDCAPE
jgi:hypothetical protein